MVRVCNDTGRTIDTLLLSVSNAARDLRAGGCTKYWDWDERRPLATEPVVVTMGTVQASFDAPSTGDPLPFGFYAYRVTIRDLDAGTLDVHALTEQPPVLARVCNETTSVVTGLHWYDADDEERALPPGACSPWRVPGEARGALALGGMPYSLHPARFTLPPGKWTLHLEISDPAARTARLRRDSTAE